MNVLYPYLSWVTTFYSVFLVQYINQPFSDQIPAFPMYWPIFYFVFVPHFLIFFLLHCCIPFPISSFSLCVQLPFSLSFPRLPYPPLSYPSPRLLSPFPVFIPYVHASVLEQNVPRTNLPQLTALKPWSMTTSPFCGNHPSLWMICSSPLFLDSSLFLSYAACSSLLLKMVTPQSLFTLFGMLLLALYFYYWFDFGFLFGWFSIFCFTLILICS